MRQSGVLHHIGKQGDSHESHLWLSTLASIINAAFGSHAGTIQVEVDPFGNRWNTGTQGEGPGLQIRLLTKVCEIQGQTLNNTPRRTPYLDHRRILIQDSPR